MHFQNKISIDFSKYCIDGGKWFFVLSSYLLCLINLGQVWNKEEKEMLVFLLIENLVQSIECMPSSSFYVQLPILSKNVRFKSSVSVLPTARITELLKLVGP